MISRARLYDVRFTVAFIVWNFFYIFALFLKLFLDDGIRKVRDIAIFQEELFLVAFINFFICTFFFFFFVQLAIFIKFIFRCSFLKHILKSAALALILLTSLTLIFLLVSSWFFWFKTNKFIYPGDLSLFLYLFDINSIFDLLSVSDIESFFYIILLSLFIQIFILFIEDSRIRKRVHIASVSCLFCLFLNFCFLPKLLSPSRYEKVVSLLGSHISAESSLLTNLFLSSSEDFKRINLDLVQRGEDRVVRVNEGRSIIVIVVEALRSDAVNSRFDNGELVMPFLNKISNSDRSFHFKRAYSVSSDTDYAMSSIITGLYPLKYKVRDNFLVNNYPYDNIFAILSDFDYQVSHFAAEWSFSKSYSESGFLGYKFDPVEFLKMKKNENVFELLTKQFIEVNEVIDLRGKYDKLIVSGFEDWLSKIDDEKDFFSVIYFYSSHFPYSCKSSDHLQGSSSSFLQYASFEAQDLKKNYLLCLNFIDGLIHKIYQALYDRGLNNVAKIILGDHGEAFYEHGNVTHGGMLYEETIRVPIIIDGVREPDTSFGLENVPVSQIDVAPTILSIAGLSKNKSFQGRNLINHNSNSKFEIENSLIYVSSQSITFEDVVIDYPYKLRVNYRGEGSGFYNLEDDPMEMKNMFNVESEQKKYLMNRLHYFRNSQLSYYSSSPKFMKKYYPPKYINIE